MTNFLKVKDFMTTMCQLPEDGSVPEVNKDIVALRLELILEEYIELTEALLSKDNIDAQVLIALLRESSHAISLLKEESIDIDKVEVADALADIEYVNSGAAHAFGIDLDKCFEEVHRSNMTKACSSEEEANKTIAKYATKGVEAYSLEVSSGKRLVLRASDNKVLKSINYSEANLAPIVEGG